MLNGPPSCVRDGPDWLSPGAMRDVLSRPCVGVFPHPHFQPAGARVWAEQPCGSESFGAGIVLCSRRHIAALSFSIALPCPKARPASGPDAIMDWTISQSLAGRGSGYARGQVQAMPDSSAARMPPADAVRLSPCCSVRTSTKRGLATISARQRRLSRGSTRFPGSIGNTQIYLGALTGNPEQLPLAHGPLQRSNSGLTAL